ncbi:hypothetical protein D3C80_1919280 [compost metagenome]
MDNVADEQISALRFQPLLNWFTQLVWINAIVVSHDGDRLVDRSAKFKASCQCKSPHADDINTMGLWSSAKAVFEDTFKNDLVRWPLYQDDLFR